MGRTIVFILLLLLLATGVVYAHVELISAQPAAGESVATAPAQIRLVFSAGVGGDSRVRLFDQNFGEIAGVMLLPSPAQELIAAVPELERGVYTVEYDALSSDGHALRGSYEFGVGTRVGGRSRWPLAAVSLLAVAAAAFWLRRR